MKLKINRLFCTAALIGATIAYAGAGHDHAHDHHGGGHTETGHAKKGGPNGGRLITVVEPALEFLVTADRTVQITFLDLDGSVVPVKGQSVSLTGGSRSNPTKIDFVEKDGLLVSTSALPDLENMPVILQIRESATATTAREKFKLNMGDCGSCDFKEYACLCGH